MRSKLMMVGECQEVMSSTLRRQREDFALHTIPAGATADEVYEIKRVNKRIEEKQEEYRRASIREYHRSGTSCLEIS